MRGIYTSKNKIRKKIFREIARFAYEDGKPGDFEALPFKIIPGEFSKYRDSIFLERAIVGQRLRLAAGLPLQRADEQSPISKGIVDAEIDSRYYEPPLVNIVKFACNGCPEKRMLVTDGCQGCFEHPCVEVCPRKAISLVNGHSHIDESLCIKCGKCASVCPYNAIIKQERPCEKACGMNAISTDEHGKANIDYDKCVSCGQCLLSCPFGAIVDKSQILQTILAIKSDTPVYVAIAPAFAGQFGKDVSQSKLVNILKALGFTDALEVAIGADLCTMEEAQDFLDEVPANQPFMATSCCPAWAMMAKKNFPQFAPYISMALTPMVLTARLIKRQHPGCKVCFIGPCAAKKLEARRKSVRSDVDFVLTFEELIGMVEGRGIDINTIPEGEHNSLASADGKGFAIGGGVAQAVINAMKEIAPDREVNVMSASGLNDCRKMLQRAKAGKLNGYLLEGMACPGGCVGGAGTVATTEGSTTEIQKEFPNAPYQCAYSTEFLQYLSEIEERGDMRIPEA